MLLPTSKVGPQPTSNYKGPLFARGRSNSRNANSTSRAAQKPGRRKVGSRRQPPTMRSLPAGLESLEPYAPRRHVEVHKLGRSAQHANPRPCLRRGRGRRLRPWSCWLWSGRCVRRAPEGDVGVLAFGVRCVGGDTQPVKVRLHFRRSAAESASTAVAHTRDRKSVV